MGRPPAGRKPTKLVEGNGSAALDAETALHLGCGTGDNSIYLAKRGWTVTGVDFVPKALDKARAKARIDNVPVNFVHADVTHLNQAGIGRNFQLIVDNGCLHNMSDADRNAYVREVSAVAAPDARLLIVAFVPCGRFSVRGIAHAEMKRRFEPAWALLSAGAERELDRAEKTPTRYYLFQRPTLISARADAKPCRKRRLASFASTRGGRYPVSESGGRNRSPYWAASSRARATKPSLPVPAGPW